MLKVIQTTWLKPANRAAQLMVMVDTSEMGQDIIAIGTELVDEKDQKFRLVSIGHVRYNSIEEMVEHQHHALVTLRPDVEDTVPEGVLKKVAA